MKTLHLLRHAKSSWDNPHLSDRDRPLSKRGLRAAPRMGAALAERLPPMRVAVSPARRAQMTLDGLCAGWPALADVRHYVEEEIYTFSSGDLFEWIAHQDDGCHSLFMIGHNPAFTDLVNSLAGGYILDNLPTAGYAELSLTIDRWCDIGPSCGQLDYSLFPKQLPED